MSTYEIWVSGETLAESNAFKCVARFQASEDGLMAAVERVMDNYEGRRIRVKEVKS